jgi:periplasmic protein TonB
MSNSALACTPRYGNVRRARLLRAESVRNAKATKPWSEVSVAGALAQTSTSPPAHIRRWQWLALTVAVLIVHGTLVWYFDQFASREPVRQEAELNIEIVRPPKPPEPPKPEPPKPTPPKVQPKEARVLPQIQQSEPLASTEGESTEPPVAVAPVVSEPEPPPPPPPEPVTEPMGRAGYLNNPAPDYPAQAVRQGWQGTVLLRVRVLANGSVESVEVKQTSGKKLLDDEAMRTVKRWSFEPAKRGTTAIDGWATVPIEFVLDQ